MYAVPSVMSDRSGIKAQPYPRSPEGRGRVKATATARDRLPLSRDRTPTAAAPDTGACAQERRQRPRSRVTYHRQPRVVVRPSARTVRLRDRRCDRDRQRQVVMIIKPGSGHTANSRPPKRARGDGGGRCASRNGAASKYGASRSGCRGPLTVRRITGASGARGFEVGHRRTARSPAAAPGIRPDLLLLDFELMQPHRGPASS